MAQKHTLSYTQGISWKRKSLIICDMLCCVFKSGKACVYHFFYVYAAVEILWYIKCTLLVLGKHIKDNWFRFYKGFPSALNYMIRNIKTFPFYIIFFSCSIFLPSIIVCLPLHCPLLFLNNFLFRCWCVCLYFCS